MALGAADPGQLVQVEDLHREQAVVDRLDLVRHPCDGEARPHVFAAGGAHALPQRWIARERREPSGQGFVSPIGSR